MAAKPPPAGAAPAHLFAPAKPSSDRLVVYTPEVLRAALHNAVARGRLDDVRLCVQRGSVCSRVFSVQPQRLTAQALAWSGATKQRAKA